MCVRDAFVGLATGIEASRMREVPLETHRKGVGAFYLKGEFSIMVLLRFVWLRLRFRCLGLGNAMCILGALDAFGGETLSWNQFGGNSGTHTAVVENALPAWPSDGPLELWSRPLGAGNSGIVIEGETLFTLFRKATSQGSLSTDETVIAVDRSNGATRWEFVYPSPTLAGQEEYGGGNGPHATPAIYEEFLFTLGYSGNLSCLNRFNGSLVWDLDLVTDLGAQPVQFGFSASPIIAGGQLVIQAAGSESGLTALDPRTGRILWRSPAAKFSYATPVLIRFAGVDQLVFMTGDTVEGIGLESGERLWAYDLLKPGLTNVPTPLWFGDGRILIGGQGVGGSELIVLSEGAKGETRVSSAWRSSRMGLFHSNWLRIDDGVYGGESFLYGMDWARGRRSWNERGYADSNLVGIGGRRAIVLAKSGLMALTELSQEGLNVVSRFQLFEEEAWTSPTVVGSVLYVRNREMLLAFDLRRAGKPLPNSSFRKMSQEFSAALESLQVELALDSVAAYLQESGAAMMEAFLLSRSLRLQREKRFDDAVALIQYCLTQVSRSSAAYGLLGKVSVAAGDNESALSAFRKAAQMDPSSTEWKLMAQQLSADPTEIDGVRFRLGGYQQADTVSVAGEFNGWNADLNPMIRQDGAWGLTLPLPGGQYAYKFVVDGEWILDPNNTNQVDDGNGNQNSLKVVP